MNSSVSGPGKASLAAKNAANLLDVQSPCNCPHAEPDAITPGPAAVVSGQMPANEMVRPLSVTDIFRVGIGPSSSHTVGPMRAGVDFARRLAQLRPLSVLSLSVDLCGSLGATGRGHSTDRAVILGLEGWQPDTVPTSIVETCFTRASGTLQVDGVGLVPFDAARDLHLEPQVILPYHVNGLIFKATAQLSGHSEPCNITHIYYSVGGGFVMHQIGSNLEAPIEVEPVVSSEKAEEFQVEAPYHFSNAHQLLGICSRTGLRISDVVRANEEAILSREDLDAYLDHIMQVMDECIENGIATEGILPGVLGVPRRAAKLQETLAANSRPDDPLRGIDWVNLWALAVNEENAAGHRVVTAPTNGAAGIIPAVLRYHQTLNPGACSDSCRRFLLAASAVGALIKTNASIAGAEVGCQGEVGSATAMAAAGLAEALGGTPPQVENAAEIAMEHSLGLTCDPVAGLVQIPCIERNAIGAVKAINAARMALWGDGRHQVALDTVIETMRQTGEDMNEKYKETSAGGLAVNVVEC